MADDLEDASDEALATVSRSNGQAFAVLYGRYVQQVFRWAANCVGPKDAEDLTQEVFIKALRAIPRFRGPSFPAWLFAIARNAARDHGRRQRLLRRNSGGPPLPGLPASQKVETRLLMDAALGSLPPRQRAAVELRYFADLSVADVGRVLNLSLGATKALLHRALESLRARIGEDGEES